MIATQVLTESQRIAVDASADGCVAICGPPGTGKTTALRARAQRLDPHAPLLEAEDVATFAFEIVSSSGVALRIDDIDAASTFAGACAPLFALNWEEIASAQLDPEVPGLRTPARFLESAFRLIRKLRDARISPSEFLSLAQTGATQFYAKPPNFADPKLLLGVKDTDRAALAISQPELERQYRREIDLAKILAKLYQRYADLVNENSRMTGRDAVEAAVERLRADESLRDRVRRHHRFAFIDEAQELTVGELTLLREMFGPDLRGVTLCGDLGSAFSAARATAGETVFATAGVRVDLTQQHRSPIGVELACRRLISLQAWGETADESRVSLFRAASQPEEAAFIADRVAHWIEAGTPAARIAVIFRSIRAVEPYERALLERGIPVVTGGDVNVFADRRALDALALLWNAYDPFRHDWLLRTLSNPAMALSDATLAILCGEPPHPQVPLFALEDEPAPTVRASRWDPRRDLRLGWNVIWGDRDGELSATACDRLQRFRALRLRWIETMQRASFEQFARQAWNDALAPDGLPGSARARAQQLVLNRLLARLRAFFTAGPQRTVADALEYASQRAASDLESCEDDGTQAAVRILSVDASRGREFDRVVVADVRAGAFPRWYVPDAFLFSPRYGMIPKENVGDARFARTAKFVYYMFRAKVRERYNARERQALVYALRRARESVLVTASHPPTRGSAAPELLEELRNAHLPGVRIETRKGA